MTTTSSRVDELNITNPDKWAAEGYPWDDFKVFRREAPIYWYEREGVLPFWSFTKQREIHFISRHPKQFSSEGKRLVISTIAETFDDYRQQEPSIITNDPPDHAIYRNLQSRLFTPRAVATYAPRVRELCDFIIDDVIERTCDKNTGVGHCDFVLDLAARLPLYFTCELLGVPREDAPYVFRLTNTILGAADPEYNQGRSPQEVAREASDEQIAYFVRMVEERKRQPKDDLTSLYITSMIRGQPMTDGRALSEMGLLMAGGFETTRNATTGGMEGLILHPDQYDMLLANPKELMPTAVEEFLRWSSPIIHFGRDCLEDIEVSGQLVRAGETICMWYASGNRDEDVFGPDAAEFKVTRQPNDHVAFGGFGEHFCLGANLARLFLRTMHLSLIDRFERFELDGRTERLRSFFLGGVKHMPVKYTVRA